MSQNHRIGNERVQVSSRNGVITTLSDAVLKAGDGRHHQRQRRREDALLRRLHDLPQHAQQPHGEPQAARQRT